MSWCQWLNVLQFLVMPNKYNVRDYSLLFTLVVTEGSEGNKAGLFQFRREYRNHRIERW
jgi:hypothetical protein